jgi:hypothetical protein
MKLAVLFAVLGAGLTWTVLGTEEKEVAASLEAARDLVKVSDRSKLVMPLDDQRRTEWSFTPGRRPGVNWGEMTVEQQNAASRLLRESLSESGFAKVEAIRALEPVLAEIERNPSRDPKRYWVMIFGEPGEKGVWSWRYEGHHLSLTFTYRDGKYASSTPQFLGSNPAIVPTGDKKGMHILRLEEELGRAFLTGLTADQKKQAVIAESAPADIATSNLRKASMLEDRGLAFSALDKDQQKKLRELVELYASILKPAARDQRLGRIADWSKLKFAWMGSSEAGKGHYYRIQGPTFVIEFDNTQNGANHIHTIWRDFEGDFGADALAGHYAASGHHAP